MDSSQLFLALFMSVVGYGYFSYGKKRPAPAFFISGLILMVVGYFVNDLLLLGLITAVLIVGPFFMR